MVQAPNENIKRNRYEAKNIPPKNCAFFSQIEKICLLEYSEVIVRQKVFSNSQNLLSYFTKVKDQLTAISKECFTNINKT